MSKKDDILNKSWLDIVFEGRNKTFGAYLLRKNYPKRLLLACCITLFFGLLTTLLFYFSMDLSNEDFVQVPMIKNIDLSKNYRQPKKIKTYKFKTQEKPALAPSQKIKKESLQQNSKHKNLLYHKTVSANLDALEASLSDDPAPAIQPINSSSNHKAVSVISHNPERHLDDFKKIIDPQMQLYDTSTMKVQRIPSFIKGSQAWLAYLHKMISIPRIVNAGAMPGKYTVTVAFTVMSDSTVKNVRIVKNPGYNMGEEVARVIKQSDKWIPGLRHSIVSPFVQLQDILIEIK